MTLSTSQVLSGQREHASCPDSNTALCAFDAEELLPNDACMYFSYSPAMRATNTAPRLSDLVPLKNRAMAQQTWLVTLAWWVDCCRHQRCDIRPHHRSFDVSLSSFSFGLRSGYRPHRLPGQQINDSCQSAPISSARCCRTACKFTTSCCALSHGLGSALPSRQTTPLHRQYEAGASPRRDALGRHHQSALATCSVVPVKRPQPSTLRADTLCISQVDNSARSQPPGANNDRDGP